MIVDLRELRPNPLRDFTVDPMDDEAVERLKESIEEDGFWGGVVCRRAPDGSLQIGCGHHRVQAALAAGIETADVYVAELDDAGMVRVYARENATQRGNTGTAQAGSVAAAIRVIAKMVLTGTSGQLDGRSASTIAGQIASEKGIGREAVADFLAGVPGINEKSVQQALSNLKASGDYARIIAVVRDEIDRENREALEALAKAEAEQREAEERYRKAEEERKAAAARAKAEREEAARKRAELDRQKAEAEAKLAEKRRREAAEQMKQFDSLRKTRDVAEKAVAVAESRPRTFDFEGVAKHLRNAHQIDVFRDVVTSEGIAPYLPVENQAELAGHLVDLVEQRRKLAEAAGNKQKASKVELTGAFIRENVATLVAEPKRFERELDQESKRKLLENDMAARAKQHQADFAAGYRIMAKAAAELAAIHKRWPKDRPFPLIGQFTRAIQDGKRVFDELNERY
jgi:hypothetical protein